MTDLTWLERAGAWLSPSWALERARARMMLDLVRGYDAASTGRRTQNWITSGNGPNAELSPSLRLLRNRSRDLVRNNPFAAHALALLPAKIVGRGIQPQLPGNADKPSRRTRDSVQRRWDEWATACDAERRMSWGKVQRVIARGVIESGECLVRPVLRRERDAPGGISLALQIIEPDYIDDTRTGVIEGRVTVQGVAFEADGRRAGYWMFKDHPGETYAGRNTASIGAAFVPASDVICVFDMQRPGQVHGVPWLAPSVLRAKFLADFDDAVLQRKRLQACFTAFVTPADSAVAPYVGTEPETATAADGAGLENIGPGYLKRMGAGESVTLASPSAGDTADTDYQILQLHAIAAGIGLTYHQLTGDLRQANYSSLRAGTIDFWALVDGWQDDLLEGQLCRPVWRQWALAAALAGVRGIPPEPRWTRPMRPFIDPAKDGEAEDAAIKAGRKTLFESIAERGRDPSDHLDELAAVNAAIDERKLVLINDLRNAPKQTADAAPPRPAADGEPDDDEQDGPPPAEGDTPDE